MMFLLGLERLQSIPGHSVISAAQAQLSSVDTGDITQVTWHWWLSGTPLVVC